MHEASLMNDLMRKIAALAEAENAGRVTCVRVRLGALSHLSADHFREHFVDASRNTNVEGAELDIEESTDIKDPNAQELVLLSIDVES